MPLTDHIAILAQSALAAPVPNKKKAGNPLQYYALIAFPPAAFNDINAMLQSVAQQNNISINPSMNMGVRPNAQTKNPLPGVPGDWFVVRTSSKFPPEIFTAQGVQLLQGDAMGTQQIRQSFFAGKKVRAMASAWPWNNDGEVGFSWNLHAVMDAGEGGERIPGIGGPNAAAAFKQFVKPAAVPGFGAPAQPPVAGFGQPQAAAPQQAVAFAPQTAATPFQQGGVPFAAATGFLQPGAGARPAPGVAFQQQAAAPAANPFVQGAQAANPFVNDGVQHSDVPY